MTEKSEIEYKTNLDKRICDVIPGATNTETFREYILNSARKFGESVDIDNMPEEEIKECIKRYDYLWEK